MTSNTSNTTSVSNAGNATTQFDTTNTWSFPDRAAQPFVWSAGGQPPSYFRAPPPADSQTNPKLWLTYWWSWMVMSQFSRLDWVNKLTMPGPPDEATTMDELATLATYARLERNDALAEILAQNNETISWFCAALAIDPVSHPATHRMISGASMIGTFVVVHFKNVYQRPRPVELMPLLLPPFIPGHPAYPSGHATQSQLVLEVLKVILNGKVGEATLIDGVTRLAARIARNREIAGVHYPSDGKDGQALATDVAALLAADAASDHPIATAFHDMTTEARNEWA